MSQLLFTNTTHACSIPTLHSTSDATYIETKMFGHGIAIVSRRIVGVMTQGNCVFLLGFLVLVECGHGRGGHGGYNNKNEHYNENKGYCAFAVRGGSGGKSWSVVVVDRHYRDPALLVNGQGTAAQSCGRWNVRHLVRCTLFCFTFLSYPHCCCFFWSRPLTMA